MLIRSSEEIKTFLEEHKSELDLPHCYLGREPNTFRKDWDSAKLRILLVAPYRYEDFRGNQSLPLLYQMINEWREDVICERAYFPSTEREYKLFRKHKIPLFSVESKRSAGEFDIIATSLSFLPPWVNFILQLEMSGIPPLRLDREHYDGTDEPKYPMILVGGSAMYGNFCIAYPVVDMIYLGDAEPGLFDLLTMWMNVKEHKLSNHEGLGMAQQDFDFIFCPRFYRPQYKDEKFLKWKQAPSAFRTKFKVIRCKDLDKAPMYTKPIPSYTDTTMGLGEVEISRGCRGVCSFCGIGWKYRPYRERSKDVMVKALMENRKQGGGTSLCPTATEFAYYTEKRGLLNELAKYSRFVDPLSMRVDAFASDREFDRFLSRQGMNQLALGVEGVSQRLRNRLLKGITESEILQACRIAIDTKGYKKIKFFMLANIDEDWKDYKEFFSLLDKVIRYRNLQKSKIQIKVSWTPIFMEPCTPLQWKKPTIEQRQPWMKISEWLDKFNVKNEEGEVLKRIVRYPQGGGGKFEDNFIWTMQGMHLGDTRFAEAFVQAALELKRPFYASFCRTMKDTITKCMKKTGSSWEHIIRERYSNEVFPWDIVDRGVKKEALLRIWEKIKSGRYDDKEIRIKPKIEAGVLDTPENDEQSYVRWHLVVYRVHGGYHMVPNSHLKALFHRAAYLRDFPLSVNQMIFLSDRDNRNWYGGYDYLLMATQREVSDHEYRSLNCETLPYFELGRRKELGAKRPRLKNVISEYKVQTGMWSRQMLNVYLKTFQNAKKVVVLQRATRYFSGTRKKEIDLKKIIFWDVRIEDYGVVKIWLSHDVDIRVFLKGFFFNKSSRKILSFSVEKVGLWEIGRGGMLREVCREYSVEPNV
jgi:radical SAM superfamily enzyme YgiQ (UPF0313 family)